ncbi:MAG: SET domain-containing protein [Solirubrobacteraceae bacterium]
MLHPATELRFIDDEIGFGVVATELIPKGTIAWVLDDLDLVLDPGVVADLDEVRRAMVLKYAYRDEGGRYVYCWDLGRFINHSFDANMIGTAYGFEVAVRDIQPGEELTDDYGTLNLEEPFDCRHEPGCDRTQALPDDLLRYADRWDRQALEALRAFDRVRQPLAELIDPRFQNAVRTAVEQGILLDSIASTACGSLIAPQRAR